MERLQLGGRLLGDAREDGLELRVGERRVLGEQAELAVPPQDRRLAGLQVNVARAELDRAS